MGSAELKGVREQESGVRDTRGFLVFYTGKSPT